jgi:hypothetical protein
MAGVTRTGRGRRATTRSAGFAGVAAAVVLALSMIGIEPTHAQADPSGGTPLPKTASVTNVSRVMSHFVAPVDQAARAFTPTRTAWPRAAAATVSIDSVKAAAGASPTTVHATGTPVWAGQSAGRGTSRGPGAVSVKVLDHAAATAAGIHGMLFTLTASSDAGSSSKAASTESGAVQTSAWPGGTSGG